jgi:hypothetical protein
MPGWDDTRFAIKLRPETEKKYKSRYLIAVKKGLKYGIVNELGKTVYPLEYEGLIKRDEIIILIKDGKMGASITNKPNKDIPVKYDSLEEQYYRTRNENAFNIFIIKLNGRTGYVGESGMEYFKD